MVFNFLKKKRYVEIPVSRASAQDFIDNPDEPSAMKKRNFKKPIDQYALTREARRDYARQAEYQQQKKEIAQIEGQRQYAQSRSGRFTSRLLNPLAPVTRKGKTYSFGYNKTRNVPLGTTGYKGYRAVRGISRGRRGRPVGSYKPEYAAVGGVYEYRKRQALERFKARQEYLRSRAINPQQQQILAQIEAREAAKRQDIERRPIADTRGNVATRGIMDEINDAANIFP